MYRLVFILTLVIAACAGESQGEDTSNPLTADDLEMSAEAYHYLDTALSIMENYSIRRDSIDWPDLRRRSMMIAKGAQSATDTYSAIHVALASLEDHHSYFVLPEESKGTDTLSLMSNQLPSASLVADRYGYIKMYGLFIGNDEEQSNYIKYVQNLIRELDRSQPCGWIIDLRDNNGGTIWPMLAGLAPVLGKGCVGMSRDVRYAYWSWIINERRVLAGELEMASMPESLPTLHQDSATVAVLTGNFTASAAEAVTVAFRGRPNTRSFGEPTNGAASGIRGFLLPDSAMLGLSTTWFMDRTGNSYETVIQPDEFVRYLPDWNYQYKDALDDPVIHAAVEWLSKQQSCQ